MSHRVFGTHHQFTIVPAFSERDCQMVQRGFHVVDEEGNWWDWFPTKREATEAALSWADVK